MKTEDILAGAKTVPYQGCANVGLDLMIELQTQCKERSNDNTVE
jgi:hypothetical protein